MLDIKLKDLLNISGLGVSSQGFRRFGVQRPTLPPPQQPVAPCLVGMPSSPSASGLITIPLSITFRKYPLKFTFKYYFLKVICKSIF